MTNATPRIFINDSHKLLDRLTAIADDMARDALGCSNEVAIDDEQPVIVALEITLHDDVAIVLS